MDLAQEARPGDGCATACACVGHDARVCDSLLERTCWFLSAWGEFRHGTRSIEEKERSVLERRVLRLIVDQSSVRRLHAVQRNEHHLHTSQVSVRRGFYQRDRGVIALRSLLFNLAANGETRSRAAHEQQPAHHSKAMPV